MSGIKTCKVDEEHSETNLSGYESFPKYARRRQYPFVWQELEPLITGDLQVVIDKERADPELFSYITR